MKILITNARLVDGSGAPAYDADVLVEGGRIAAIGTGLSAEGARQVEAAGRVLTPGFIDIHRHADLQPFLDQAEGEAPFADHLLKQGITTIVNGNCGISHAPLTERALEAGKTRIDAPVMGNLPDPQVQSFPAYLEALDGVDLPVNFLSLPGLGTLQIAVNGYEAGRLSEAAIQEVQGLVAEALDAGAPGVSIGLMYLPEIYRTQDQVVAMLKPLGSRGKVLTTHIRGEGDSLVASVDEVLAIAREVGCPLQISHFKSGGRANWGKAIHEAIARVEEARAQGQVVRVDFYPYDAGATSLNTMIPPSFVEGDMNRALQKMQTPAGVEELRDGLDRQHPGWDNYALTVGWDRVIISGVTLEANKRCQGLTVTEAAARYYDGDVVRLVCDLMVTEDGVVGIMSRTMSQDDIDTVARLPYSVLISDSIYGSPEFPHPRLNGAFPKFLREYVQERSVVTLEEAIYKMTRLPGEVMGLADRGRLEVGARADLNLFDLERFRDRATYTDGRLLAEGLDLCLVNGEPALADGEVLRQDLGSMLRI